MSDKKNDENPPIFSAKESEAHAEEIASVMVKALEAAVSESKHPGWALAALRMATCAMRRALIKEDYMDEEAAKTMEEWVDGCITAEPDFGTALAEREMFRRSVKMPDTEGGHNMQAAINAGTQCLNTASEYATDPMGILVVLTAARYMAMAVFKHEHPDDYEEAYTLLRAFENTIRPKTVGVVEVPRDTTMSKGGSA
jgi:hypothetical protein